MDWKLDFTFYLHLILLCSLRNLIHPKYLWFAYATNAFLNILITIFVCAHMLRQMCVILFFRLFSLIKTDKMKFSRCWKDSKFILHRIRNYIFHQDRTVANYGKCNQQLLEWNWRQLLGMIQLGVLISEFKNRGFYVYVEKIYTREYSAENLNFL